MKKKLPRHDSGRVSYDERTTKGTTPLDYCAFILFVVNKKSKKNNHYLLIFYYIYSAANLDYLLLLFVLLRGDPTKLQLTDNN